ncbi:MAG: hypothetical protein AAGI70_11715, partial [Pseudomonadota bacterium]
MPAPVLAQGVAGPYLAAEQAARRGDIAEASRLFAKVLARDPQNIRILEQTMLNQLGAGQIAQAVSVARRLTQLREGHHLGVLILAADGMRKGEYESVAELLDEKGGEGGPFVGYMMRGWALYGAGDLDGARAVFDNIEAREIGGAAGQLLAAHHKGLMLAAAGEDAEAIDPLVRAAELANQGGTTRMIRQRAAVLARLGRTEEAQ